MTHNIDPVLIRFGFIEIRYYGLMYVLGFIIAFFVLRYLSKKTFLKLTYPEISDLLFWGFVGLLVGARVFYVFVYNFPLYIKEPIRILMFWKGGLSFHGGMLGVLVAVWIFARKKHLPLAHLADSIVLIAPLGLFFGRIGNFLNGELYGKVTTLPWGIIFPIGGPLPRHPSQLYEALGEGLLLASLLWFSKRFVKHQGVLTALFLIFYGIIRFFIEFFRLPDRQLGYIIGPFSMGQLLCFFMIIAGGILLSSARKGRFGTI
ncbi:MAG TPA: prolipoprotein diacylglyceryl transferase [Bdellovibrionota bacterium]|nr:prolipoprotein diacylglyceryl transferase [Bdellovibrionota bacterium]